MPISMITHLQKRSTPSSSSHIDPTSSSSKHHAKSNWKLEPFVDPMVLSSSLESSTLSPNDTHNDDEAKLRLLTAKFQAIRSKDFGRLDEQSTVYLDYTGASLAPKQLVESHAKILTTETLGNPHSDNTPSQAATQYDQLARSKVLEFVNADPEEYMVVWTSNASGALKLLGECYPFHRNNAYIHGPDCHNSVLGITQFAGQKKARTAGFGFLKKSLCYDWEDYKKCLKKLGRGRKAPGLVAFPGESNTSGLKHNVSKYANQAHQQGWDVCVDVAAYAPTTPIDVDDLGKPEFLAMSFYKIFGYPTGVGCLVVKRSAARKLNKPWFAGGTVAFVGASNNKVIPFLHAEDDPSTFEDGTINFQNFAAVAQGIDYMMNVVGMQDLDAHVTHLANGFLHELRQLQWSNGAPLIYIPCIEEGADERQGHALSMIFMGPDGKQILPEVIEKALLRHDIAVRVGCFCNPNSGFQMLQGTSTPEQPLIAL